jgi:hypothetical protein
LAETPLNFLLLSTTLAAHLGLQEPVVVSIVLVGVAGLELSASRIYRGRWSDQRDLIVPPMQFPYPINPHRAANHIATRIWNAFGLEECPLFDGNGQFEPKRLRL